jgi:DNA repair exonuclease SbcCD ATPase subunit
MITSIYLKKYGKFIDKQFRLSPLTLFLGKNESGKTTIFDALFDCLCAPKGTTSDGKRLKERYGEDRDAKIEFDSNPLLFDADEFLNLYAINSGDINLELSAGKSWMDKVKSSLFSGGLDPKKIAGLLELEASTHAGRKHMKILNKKKEELSALENELAQLKGEKQAVLERERLIKANIQALNQIKEKMVEQEKLIRTLLEKLEQQQKNQERQKCMNALGEMEKGTKIEKSLEELSDFSGDRSAELSRIGDSIKGAEQKLLQGKGRLEAEEKILNGIKEKAGQMEEEKERKKYPSDIASRFLSAIRSGKPKPVVKKKTRWNILLLIPAFLFPAAGFSSLIFLSDFLFQIGIIVFGFLTGTIFLLLARKTYLIEDNSPLVEFVNQTKTDWLIKMGREFELKGHSLEDITQELYKIDGEYHHFALQYRDVLESCRQQEKIKQQASDECLELQRQLDQQKQRLASWLNQYGLKSPDDYFQKRKEYINTKQNYEMWQENIQSILKGWDFKDTEELKTECYARFKLLEKEITEAPLSPNEEQRLKNQLEQAQGKMKELTGEKGNIQSRIDREEGIVKGSMGNIPEKIIVLENKIRDTLNEINSMEQTRKANALASAIFLEMAEDSEILFQDLSKDMIGFLKVIINRDANIEMNQLDAESIFIQDAGNTLRSIDLLSRGTQDCFFLAARLTLALKAAGSPSLLILDEPFHALDPGRVLSAVTLLKEFYEQTNWQIIFFSKEPDFEGLFKKVFPDVRTYRLSP